MYTYTAQTKILLKWEENRLLKEGRTKEEDLPKIEKRMRQIVKRSQPIVRKEMSRDAALKLFDTLKEPYKLEIINDLDETIYSVYEQGDWQDLCRGPHIPSTGRIDRQGLFRKSTTKSRPSPTITRTGPIMPLVQKLRMFAA